MISKIRKLRERTGLIKIFYNIGWQFFDKVIRMALSLIVGIWVARYLGPSNFGILNYGIAFIALFMPFSTAGLDTVLVREIIKNPSDTKYLLGASFYLKIIFGITSYILSITISYLLNPDNYLENLTVAILGIGLITQAFDTIEYYLQSKLNVKLSVIAKTSAFILVAGLRVVFILNESPLIYFICAGAIELLIATLFLVIINRGPYNISTWKWSSIHGSKLLKDSWPLILSSFAIMIYMRIDQIMINQMLGNSSVGIYSAAVRVSEVFYFIPMTISNSIFPKLVQLKNASKELFAKRLSQFFILMTWVSICIALSVTVFADNIIAILYGPNFSESAKILSIQTWAGIFVFLGVAGGQYLMIENLTKYAFYQTVTGAVVNVGLNLILIPAYGIIGSSIATVIAYSCSAVFSNAFFSKTRIVFFMQLNSFNFLKYLK